MPKNSIISEGNTTNEAIENGLKILNVSKNMVNVKVLENEQKRSFFSILAPRVVKVELTLKEESEREESEERVHEKHIKKEKQPVSNENIEKAEENVKVFLDTFLKQLGNDTKYDIKKDNYGLEVTIEGEDAAILIGYRGETLYALQTLISSVAGKNLDEKIRVLLDIGNYKEKREKTLENLALKLAKSKGAITLAISNVIGSSITREADYCIYTHAGPEIAVASTKAYTSQVVLLDILAVYFAEILGTTPILQLQNIKKEILALPAKIDEALKCSDRIKTFANKIYQEKDIFFLGRGADYNTALEGSLKLKEISYIHSEAYAAGELKHGPIALIENGITVIGIMTDKLLVEKSISNLQEVITRGAKTLVVTNQNLPANNFETIITVPDTDTLLSPILAIVPLQLLAYFISKEKGLDVDKPRNLAKSVTVE